MLIENMKDSHGVMSCFYDYIIIFIWYCGSIEAL